MADPLAWSTVAVRGPDATTFLDGQVTQDLRVPEARWSLLLEPSGTVISTLWARPVDEGWDLLVPRDLAGDVEARLRRFKVRVRCEIALEDRAVEPPLATEDDLFEQAMPWVAELARGLAPHSFGGTFVARTISFAKGCFTGQELVGRMDARGATMPWRYVRAFGPTVEAIDAWLHSTGPDGPRGVTRSRVVDGGVEVLGFAHRSLLAAEPATDVRLEAIE